VIIAGLLPRKGAIIMQTPDPSSQSTTPPPGSGYQQPNYQLPPNYQPPPGYSPLQPGMQGPLYIEPPTSAYAIASLVFGILGFVGLPLIGSIAAIVFGYIARGELRTAQGGMKGDNIAMVGLVLGYVGVALAVLLVLFILLIVGVSVFSHSQM
jgi:Domain of unknown function (DUF4190)